MTGVWVLGGAVAAALTFGLWRASARGRFRVTRAAEEFPETAPASVLAGTPWADRLGDRATLVQFSTAFCAPCRATRALLSDVAERDGGVAHVEVDAEQNLDLVRRLGILRTPTTVLLDSDGREFARATGAPRREQVLAALGSNGSDLG